jgi:Tfp pilus assembly protein PilF
VLLRGVVIAVAAAIVYANSLSAPFIFDDEVAIFNNPTIRSVSTVWSQPRNTPLAGRPVAALTFALNFAVNEIDPAPYRATNVAIHIACALLLFALIRRTLSTPSLRPRFGAAGPDLAFASTLLWVVHPLTTDAVTYITQRTESLMALCFLLTLYASLRAARRSTIDDRRSTIDDRRWTIVSVAACALGMAVKESMVTAPLVVVLFDRIFLFDSFRAAVAARWRLYAAFASTWIVLISQLAATPRQGSAGFAAGVSVWTYLLNQCVMIARYLRLAVWPSDLVINYGPPVSYALGDVVPHALLVIALLLVTLAAFRWNAAAAFLGAWFFITLAPSSSVVPIATEVGAERRMYLPLMAMTVAMVVGVFSVRGVRQRVSRGVGAVLLTIAAVALGTATIMRNAEHHSWMTLAQTTLVRWPTDVAHAAVGSELARLRRDEEALPLLRIGARSDVRARYNLGIALFNLKRYDEAIDALDVLVTEHPMREEVPWARRVMGHAYIRLGKWPDAIAQLRMTLAMTPADTEARRLLVDAHNSYGVDLAQAQTFVDAIAQFRAALGYDDRNASARYNLATALFDVGQTNDAFTEVERAIAVDPANADAHHLKAKLLALQGRRTESLATFETAIKLRPDDPVILEDRARVQRK